MDYSGKVTVVLGSSSTGMSVTTTMKQVVAEHLGCALEDVSIVQGDTAATPYGAGTVGSRSAVLYGNAVAAATIELRSKLLDIAADALEAAVEDLEIENSRVFVRGTPVKGMDFAELGELAYIGHDMLAPGTTPGLEVSHRFKAPPFTFSNACHMCTCEVDVDTGRVTILRYVVSEDCGRMINPKIVEGQIFGGVVQGLGGVLYENMVYDDDGNPLASTFVDYLVPTASEVPSIDVGHIESPRRKSVGGQGNGRRWRDRVPRRRHQRRRRRVGPARRQGLRLPARAQGGPRHGCRGRRLSTSQRSSRDDLDQLFECVEVVAVDELIDVRQCGGHTARQRGVAGRRLQWVHPHHPVSHPRQACHLIGDDGWIAALPTIGEDDYHSAPRHSAHAPAVVVGTQGIAQSSASGPVGHRGAGTLQGLIGVAGRQLARQPGETCAHGEGLDTSATGHRRVHEPQQRPGVPVHRPADIAQQNKPAWLQRRRVPRSADGLAAGA